MKISTYLKINAKYSNPFVFSLTSRGFYSEINNLLNAILFGLITKRRLYVDQSSFAGGDLKWADLYQSDLPWVTKDIQDLVDPRWIIEGVEGTGFWDISSFINERHRNRIFFLLRSYGFYGGIFAAKRHLAHQFCQPVVPLNWPESLQLPYAAIHVRRGDKIKGYISPRSGELIIDGDQVILDEYLSILRRRSPHLKSLFVMTDDYQVIDELQTIDPNLNIFTFCEKEEQGYTQDEFNGLGSQSKTMAIRKLISEVDIACNSQIFVGCYKSNVSRYVALAHKYPKQCYSADAQKKWDPC